jgi:hypothetical protein
MTLSAKQMRELNAFYVECIGKIPLTDGLFAEAARIGALWIADACRNQMMTCQGHEPELAGIMEFIAKQLEAKNGDPDRVWNER